VGAVRAGAYRWHREEPARVAVTAALGLLSVTLLKLFFHDLAHLNQLYRIGAFFGVAVIAIARRSRINASSP